MKRENDVVTKVRKRLVIIIAASLGVILIGAITLSAMISRAESTTYVEPEASKTEEWAEVSKDVVDGLQSTNYTVEAFHVNVVEEADSNSHIAMKGELSTKEVFERAKAHVELILDGKLAACNVTIRYLKPLSNGEKMCDVLYAANGGKPYDCVCCVGINASTGEISSYMCGAKDSSMTPKADSGNAVKTLTDEETKKMEEEYTDVVNEFLVKKLKVGKIKECKHSMEGSSGCPNNRSGQFMEFVTEDNKSLSVCIDHEDHQILSYQFTSLECLDDSANEQEETLPQE